MDTSNIVPNKAATQTHITGTADESENQPVACIHKKKYEKKKISVHLVRDVDELVSSQEREEEAELEIITSSLSLSEMRDM